MTDKATKKPTNGEGSDHPRQTDEAGVNPSGLGPAQPRKVDNDNDQVPTDVDRERLSEDEYLDLSRTIERERDA